MALDPAISIAVSAALCLLWVSAGVQKLIHPGHHRAALANYELLPQSWVFPASVLLPLLEIAIGFAVVVPALATIGASSSIVLLGIYTLAVSINLARGRRDIECGCGGPALRQSLSGGLVARNVFLIGTSAVVLVPPAQRPLVWVDFATVVGAVAVAGLLYTAANQALAQASFLASARR